MLRKPLFWSQEVFFFFSCYDFCLHCLSVFADSADARFMCLIYTPDRCTVHWKGSFFLGGGLHLQCERKGSKAGTKLLPQSPLSPLTSRIKGISTFGLQCIILCQRIGLIGTKPDTFVAKKKKRKMPRLGGLKMWDHVNRPPVGLSLLFQYHSCQGPCTRWHSLSPREKMFQFSLGGKKKKRRGKKNPKHKTQGLWQVSALTNPQKGKREGGSKKKKKRENPLFSIVGHPSKHPNGDV